MGLQITWRYLLSSIIATVADQYILQDRNYENIEMNSDLSWGAKRDFMIEVTFELESRVKVHLFEVKCQMHYPKAVHPSAWTKGQLQQCIPWMSPLSCIAVESWFSMETEELILAWTCFEFFEEFGHSPINPQFRLNSLEEKTKASLSQHWHSL